MSSYLKGATGQKATYQNLGCVQTAQTLLPYSCRKASMGLIEPLFAQGSIRRLHQLSLKIKML